MISRWLLIGYWLLICLWLLIGRRRWLWLVADIFGRWLCLVAHSSDLWLIGRCLWLVNDFVWVAYSADVLMTHVFLLIFVPSPKIQSVSTLVKSQQWEKIDGQRDWWMNDEPYARQQWKEVPGGRKEDNCDHGLIQRAAEGVDLIHRVVGGRTSHGLSWKVKEMAKQSDV